MSCARDDAPGYTCGGSKGYPPCGQHFGSLASFDRHLLDGRCATDAELTAMGLTLADNKVWREPMDEVTAAQLGRQRRAVQEDILGLLR